MKDKILISTLLLYFVVSYPLNIWMMRVEFGLYDNTPRETIGSSLAPDPVIRALLILFSPIAAPWNVVVGISEWTIKADAGGDT